MIQLSRNPIEGGSIVIRLSFKDSSGVEYVPIDDSVSYSLYAKDEAGDKWTVVNFRRDFPLDSASTIDIVLQCADLELLPGCTTKRRVIVEWSYLRNGEETIGKDMVDFSITPLPVVA